MITEAGFPWRTRRTFEVHRLLLFTASCSVAKGVDSGVKCLPCCLLCWARCAHHAHHFLPHRTMLRRARCRSQRHRGRHCWFSHLGIRRTRCSPRSHLCRQMLFPARFRSQRPRGRQGWFPRRACRTHAVHYVLVFTASCCVGKRWRFQSHRAGIVVSTAGPPAGHTTLTLFTTFSFVRKMLPQTMFRS